MNIGADGEWGYHRGEDTVRDCTRDARVREGERGRYGIRSYSCRICCTGIIILDGNSPTDCAWESRVDGEQTCSRGHSNLMYVIHCFVDQF